MSTASAWYNAYVAILFISTLPNALLLLIPTHLLVGDDGVRSSVLSTAGINYQSLLLSFSAAGLMGDVFIHTLPHLLSSHNNHVSHVHHHGEEEEGEEHSNSTGRTDRNMLISLTLLIGYLTFLTVERLFTCNHSHHDKMHNGDAHVQRTPHNGATTAVVNAVNDASHGDRSSLVRRSKGDYAQFKAAHKDGPVDNKEPLFEGPKHGTEDGKQSRWPLVEALRNLHVTGWLNLVADSLHNFTDGIAIGASFASGRGLAYATFLSVIIHEIPHELGDFTILLQSGMTKHQAIQAQFVTAIAAIAGTSVGLMSTHYDDAEDYLLAFTAGGFLHLATVTILSSREKSSHQGSVAQIALEVLCFVTGIAMMVTVAILE